MLDTRDLDIQEVSSESASLQYQLGDTSKVRTRAESPCSLQHGGVQGTEAPLCHTEPCESMNLILIPQRKLHTLRGPCTVSPGAGNAAHGQTGSAAETRRHSASQHQVQHMSAPACLFCAVEVGNALQPRLVCRLQALCHWLLAGLQHRPARRLCSFWSPRRRLAACIPTCSHRSCLTFPVTAACGILWPELGCPWQIV